MKKMLHARLRMLLAIMVSIGIAGHPQPFMAASPQLSSAASDDLPVSFTLPTDGLAQKTPPAPMEKLSQGDVSLLNQKMQSYTPQI